jgi:hypothetical protein
MSDDEQTQDGPAGDGSAPQDLDRRSALRRIAALGGAAVVGAAVLRPDPAGAASGTMVYGNSGSGNDAAGSYATLRSDNTSYTLNLLNGTYGTGLVAQSATGYAALFRQNGGTSFLDGVRIERLGTGTGAGLYVLSLGSGAGIRASRGNGAASGATVDASQSGSGPVYRATAGSGNAEPLLDGTHSGLGQGVQVLLTSSASSASAVKATTKGVGVALRGTVDNPSSPAQAIRGDTNGTGYAIYGQTTGNRAALGGNGGTVGRGAVLISNVAQLRLQPSTLATHPASGQAGDLFADASKRLWFCRGGSDWKQIA